MKTIRELERMLLAQQKEIQLLRGQLERLGRHPIVSSSMLLGKTTDAEEVDGIIEVDLYEGTWGSESNSGETVRCRRRLAEVETNVWCYIGLVNGRMELINAECESSGG